MERSSYKYMAELADDKVFATTTFEGIEQLTLAEPSKKAIVDADDMSDASFATFFDKSIRERQKKIHN